MNPAQTTIVITGGASGIGRAMAGHLLALGAQVWLVDRDAAALEATLAQFQGPSLPSDNTLPSHNTARGSIAARLADVGREDQAIEAVRHIDRQSAGIDVLVNNAAVLRDQALVSKLGKRLKKHSLADWNETLASNLTGPFLMAREVAESMITRKRPGLIVNVSSISRAGNPGQSAYAATKAALAALTVTWSQELAVHRIRVAGLAPGFVETSMTQAIPPLFLERIRERTPVGRYGTLEEFGLAIEFIVRNDYFNGRLLELDGGLRF